MYLQVNYIPVLLIQAAVTGIYTAFVSLQQRHNTAPLCDSKPALHSDKRLDHRITLKKKTLVSRFLLRADE